MNIKQFVGVNAFGIDKNGNTISHEEKFGKVVEAIGVGICMNYVPVRDKGELKRLLSEDEHLNNIPHKQWTDQHKNFVSCFKGIGVTSVSISDTVCTLKEAARIYAES